MGKKSENGKILKIKKKKLFTADPSPIPNPQPQSPIPNLQSPIPIQKINNCKKIGKNGYIYIKNERRGSKK